jgi:uncharacterized protein YqgC (DUF456 family)
MTGVHVLVGVLMAAGLVGSVLPFLPGTPLILVGAIVHGFATGWDPIGPGRLAILGGLTALAYVLGHVAGALGAQRFGGSRWAIAGALAGAFVGVFFGPLGLLVGPVAGAIAGELLYRGDVDASVRSGVGAFVGMVAGIVANLALALVMVTLFLYWVWRG